MNSSPPIHPFAVVQTWFAGGHSHRLKTKLLTRYAVLLFTSIVATTGHAAGPTGTLLVLNKSDATASLISLRTNEIVATVATGSGPHEVAVSPDGSVAVVSNYGRRTAGSTLTVIDIKQGTATETIRLGVYRRPHGSVYLPDGKTLLVTAEQNKALVLVDVIRAKVKGAIATGQEGSHMVVASPRAHLAFVANIRSGSVSVLDLAASKRVATVVTGAGAEGLGISPDEKEIWVANRADNTLSILEVVSLQVVKVVPCRSFPIRVKFTADGKYVLVSNARSGDVAVFDRKARTEVRRIAMGSRATEDKRERLFRDRFGDSPVPVGILTHPDGHLAYVANTNADVIAVIDLQQWAVVDRLKAGREPDGLGYSPLEVNPHARKR